ncbi:MAG: LLM class flavin-dependent oxidoreductase, partial [Candidatus Bathyarchaeia archaeon]
KNIPIYVAGMGPKMTRLAAEIGDGVLLSAGWSTQLVKQSIDLIRVGSRKGGRDLAKQDVACLISFSVSEDGKPDFGTQGFVACAVTQFFDEKTLQLDGISKNEVAPVKKAFETGGFEEAAKYVTKRMVDAYSITGTAKDCVHKLREYTAAGVKLPVILPIGGCDVSAAIKAGKDFIQH